MNLFQNNGSPTSNEETPYINGEKNEDNDDEFFECFDD
jgi:hypothetical protein